MTTQCTILANHRFVVSSGQLVSSRIKLDAIFIPINRVSIELGNRIEEISSFADEVWIIATDQAIPFFRTKYGELPSNVRVLYETINDQLQEWFLNVPSSKNPSSKFQSDYDIPLKRNIALQLSKEIGYERICLLDDDIFIDSDQVITASSLLSNNFPIVGFVALDFPDVSTLEHIERLTLGIVSETIPGGNCLFLMPQNITGFFPYIYNEDWLFVNTNLLFHDAYLLGEVQHKKHEPWKDLNRVRFEEFGDAIITGVLSLSRGVYDQDALLDSFWCSILHERMDWLIKLRSHQTNLEFKQAIDTAIETLETINSTMCLNFLVAYLNDLENIPCIPNLSKLL